MDADLPPNGNTPPNNGSGPPSLPIHRQPRYLGLVWAGGAAGSGVRYLLSQVVPRLHQVPVATWGINVVGAFALGLLLEALARRGADVGRRRVLRLLLGTGFLGGFTTYSALAVDTVTLLTVGLVGRAIAYALATVVVGAGASLAGIAVGARLRPPEHGHPA